jgi:hypothetical protein
MIRRLLQARRVLDPPQRQLRQQLNNAPPPLLRQRLPNGLGSGEAHGAIQASARSREALCSPESATRKILSTYKRHLLWDIELAFKRLKSLLNLDRLPARTEKGARSWIYAHLILAIATDEFSQDVLESSP